MGIYARPILMSFDGFIGTGVPFELIHIPKFYFLLHYRMPLISSNERTVKVG